MNAELLLQMIEKSIEGVVSQLHDYRAEGKKVFITSSFQSHSIPLLHVISQIDYSIPVYFLDTGFHFPETLIYRDEIVNLLNLELRILSSPISKVNQLDQTGRFFFCSNTDYCCHINKVLPLESTIKTHDVWISGVRADQSSTRKVMQFKMEGKYGVERYHPFLEWNNRMIWTYRNLHELPPHPLEEKGFLSIGCSPCTSNVMSGERTGRWSGQSKIECGLHLGLKEK